MKHLLLKRKEVTLARPCLCKDTWDTCLRKLRCRAFRERSAGAGEHCRVYARGAPEAVVVALESVRLPVSSEYERMQMHVAGSAGPHLVLHLLLLPRQWGAAQSIKGFVNLSIRPKDVFGNHLQQISTRITDVHETVHMYATIGQSHVRLRESQQREEHGTTCTTACVCVPSAFDVCTHFHSIPALQSS
jgi:hypothetical protein